MSEEFDIKSLSERDICTKFITPALTEAGWDLHSQIREEINFTDGRIVVRGQSESLLMVVRGMILIHSFPVAISKRELTINQDMKALVLGEKELAEYLLLIGQACRDRMLEVVQRSTHGTCRIATEDVENFVVGLPPLAEQKRIVSKVSVLLSQLDKLSAQLRNRQSTTEALLTAQIHAILNGAS